MSDDVNKNQEITAPYTPPQRVQFKQKGGAKTEIPTASMPDIVFMLILFFMVTTVFQQYKGLAIELPSASQIEKLPGKRNVSYIWIDQDDQISIDDILLELKQVASLMYEKRVANPRIVVSLRIDRLANMKTVSGVQQQLREADALKINYSTKFAPK
ncbi:biopolymer transporter ExbD [candidate division KSB1 bacterium]|nr:biopolymer transporter ExbD [candidate division KSB1 bacterium]